MLGKIDWGWNGVDIIRFVFGKGILFEFSYW